MRPELREKRFRNVGDPRRTDRFKSTYEHGVHSPFVLHAIAAYERAFKLMEQTLAERGPWLLGESPTLADINLMPFAARLSYLGLLEAWTDEPAAHATTGGRGCSEWPSFKRGLHDLISEPEFAEMRTHGPKIRDDVEKLIAGLRAKLCRSTGSARRSWNWRCARQPSWPCPSAPERSSVGASDGGVRSLNPRVARRAGRCDSACPETIAQDEERCRSAT